MKLEEAIVALREGKKIRHVGHENSTLRVSTCVGREGNLVDQDDDSFISLYIDGEYEIVEENTLKLNLDENPAELCIKSGTVEYLGDLKIENNGANTVWLSGEMITSTKVNHYNLEQAVHAMVVEGAKMGNTDLPSAHKYIQFNIERGFSDSDEDVFDYQDIVGLYPTGWYYFNK